MKTNSIILIHICNVIVDLCALTLNSVGANSACKQKNTFYWLYNFPAGICITKRKTGKGQEANEMASVRLKPVSIAGDGSCVLTDEYTGMNLESKIPLYRTI